MYAWIVPLLTLRSDPTAVVQIQSTARTVFGRLRPSSVSFN